MTAFRWKRGVLGVALVATLVAAWRAPVRPDEGVALSSQAQTALARPVGPAQPVSQGTLAAQVQVLQILPREADRDDSEREGRLFASATPAPSLPARVAAPQPAAGPPSPLPAPALPFLFLGRYDDAGESVVLLQHQDQNLAVRKGDTVAGHYKVESLSGTAMTFRYLPLDQVQTLEIGGHER